MWHSHITANKSLRVRSDIIRTQGEINTPHCGWPQPQPRAGTAGKPCWVAHSFWEGTQMAANRIWMNMERTSGGFWAGKGCFGSSLPAVNDPADLRMNSAILVRGRRCFACFWWQTLGLVSWDVSILSPVLLLCFQPEVPACSALLQPSSGPRQKGCYTNNNSVTSPDQCHPSLQENKRGKALKELQKNSVSGVGMKWVQLYHAAFKATSY